MGMATNMSSTFKHDVFLSYSHRDGEWVVGQLLPRLQNAGLAVMYDGRFAAGVPSVVNMTQAVKESRHVVVVLTPAWVESLWTGFEALLTTTAAPAGAGRRLIPLLLEPCQPPEWISLLTHIDVTQPAKRDAGLEKLLQDLAGGGMEAGGGGIVASLPAEPVRGEPVRRGLAALGELLEEEEARRAVVAFSIHFREANQQVEVLNSYKDLHDLLHRLQHDVYEPIAQEAKRFPDDEDARENLLVHEQGLQEALDELADLVAHGTFISDEPARIQAELGEARETLRPALEASDVPGLRKAIWRLNHVLALMPPKINVRLNDAARALNLEDLAASMEIVCRKLRELGLRPEQVDQFEEGVAALARLAGTLTTLVGDHDRWQWVEQELRRIEGDLARSLEELENSWPQLKSQMEPLYAGSAESWAVALKTDGEKLEVTLATQDLVKVRQCFRSYRRQAGRRFFRVDDTLKRQCHELRHAGEPLAAVLRILG